MSTHKGGWTVPVPAKPAKVREGKRQREEQERMRLENEKAWGHRWRKKVR